MESTDRTETIPCIATLVIKCADPMVLPLIHIVRVMITAVTEAVSIKDLKLIIVSPNTEAQTYPAPTTSHPLTPITTPTDIRVVEIANIIVVTIDVK